MGDLSVSWRKSFTEEDGQRQFDGESTVALSAFMLTRLATPLERKALVKQMWESGAHVMVKPTVSISTFTLFLLNLGVD